MDWAILGHRRQGSFASEPLRSKVFPELPLLNASHQPVFRYGYYVQFRTEKTWKVPMLHARMPRVPDSQSTAAEKGDYALFLIILFRPHRDILQIALHYRQVPPAAKNISKEAATEGTWLAIYEEFLR